MMILKHLLTSQILKKNIDGHIKLIMKHLRLKVKHANQIKLKNKMMNIFLYQRKFHLETTSKLINYLSMLTVEPIFKTLRNIKNI